MPPFHLAGKMNFNAIVESVSNEFNALSSEFENHALNRYSDHYGFTPQEDTLLNPAYFIYNHRHNFFSLEKVLPFATSFRRIS